MWHGVSWRQGKSVFIVLFSQYEILQYCSKNPTVFSFKWDPWSLGASSTSSSVVWMNPMNLWCDTCRSLLWRTSERRKWIWSLYWGCKKSVSNQGQYLGTVCLIVIVSQSTVSLHLPNLLLWVVSFYFSVHFFGRTAENGKIDRNRSYWSMDEM